MKVGVFQGCALSSLSFIMIMDILIEDVTDVSLMELLYADDLVLCGESLNELMNDYRRWKNAMEGKGMRVNVDKMKGMRLLFGKKSSALKVDPCGVCGEWVSCNSLQCKNVRGGLNVVVLISLLPCQDVFVCRKCLGHNCSVGQNLKFKKGEDVLEEVETFFYLGDMTSC